MHWAKVYAGTSGQSSFFNVETFIRLYPSYITADSVWVVIGAHPTSGEIRIEGDYATLDDANAAVERLVDSL
jgi:hypothetical protein